MYSTKRANKFILISIIYIISSSIAMGLIFEFALEQKPSTLWLLPISQISAVAIPVLAYFIISKDKSTLIGRLSVKEVILLIIFSLCLLPLLNSINIASLFFTQNHIGRVLESINDTPFLTMLAFTALMPAILEELMTRAVIINNYKRQKVITTMLVSGLFFGMIHMNINQFLYAFIMGMVMVYAVLITESIFASMIIHFTINAFAVLMLQVQKNIQANMANLPADIKTKVSSQVMEAASPSNTQLLSALIGIVILAIIVTPIAYFIIYVLANNRNKTLKGSLSMLTMELAPSLDKDYIKAIAVDENKSSASVNELIDKEANTDDIRQINTENLASENEEIKSDEIINRNSKKEKALTLSLVVAVSVFLAFLIITSIIAKNAGNL